MIIVYCVAKNREEARSIAEELVEQRLCACVNIIPGMESVYRWNGKVETAEEAVLLVKTEKERYADVESAILALHTYKTPAIFSLEVSDCEPHFAQWVRDESAG